MDLTIEVTPSRDGGSILRIEYDCRKYDSVLIDALASAYMKILTQLNLKNVRDINVLPDTVYHRIVEEFNDTFIEYPKDKCVHELFGEWAKKTPEKVAVVFKKQKYTYKQLDEMSNALAHYLREKGIGRGDIVALVVERSAYILVTMLGVLKSGAAYIPLSPEYPKDRIDYILKISKCKLALCYGYEASLLVEQVNIIDLPFDRSVLPINNVNHTEDLCYVIFTSGSTGTPKGVAICHKNVVNFCDNNGSNVCSSIIKEEYTGIVGTSSFFFDMSVTELILPLLNGITIYLADERESVEQDGICKLICDNHAEVLEVTPTKMKLFMADKEKLDYLKFLRAIIIGGETFPQELYEEMRKYTDAKIFNNYGPAETTVWSTYAEVTDNDLTIGSPIANTQVYIVDGDYNILPIGVAGELCIAGDGVGLGYLNRPELTEERFIKNPFATEGNRHGEIMYRTGDLARWREDGKIEYLGRIDTQVKIRGLRIELGEIESVMASFPGISLCAVTDKKGETERQYLVGYYAAEAKIDEKELRKHLSSKLPKYMVPNYFLCLTSMPMTPSGKIDRKNLPVPSLAIRTETYIAPETESEKTLCSLVEGLLGIERIGVTDDFFEFGGDSLTAIEYVARAHDIGIDFSLQTVFDYSTVRELCSFLDKGNVSHVRFESEEFGKYQNLFMRNRVDESVKLKKRSLGNVFLTGATGFLGAHVLDWLMREGSGKIYCLVRNSGSGSGANKLRKILQYYFGSKYDETIGDKIIPIVGDIEEEVLSTEMPWNVQTVIHTAASVKHYGSYDYFCRVNIEGTRHVVNYAQKTGARLIHISTLSVSGNSAADAFNTYQSPEEKYFNERSFYIGQPLDNVYVRSKFEAERVVYDAMLLGLDAKVVRVGNLTNRIADFKFQPNYKENAFLKRMKSMLEFGVFPDYLMPLYCEFSPIDMTAEGVVKIAQYSDDQSIFHLYNNKPIYFDSFLEVLHKLGISMKVVEGKMFQKMLQHTLKEEGRGYIFEAFQNEMDKDGRLIYDNNIHVESDFSVWFLKKIGFEWSKTDLEYINGYIEYFRNLGYLDI